MRRLPAAILLVLIFSANAFAQDADAAPAAPGASPVAAGRPDTLPAGRDGGTGVRDKKFWLVAGALNGAMLIDTHSTFTVLARCPDCRERNPLVAPFVNRGPGLTYTAGELFDAGVMAVSARMRASPRTWVRRTWWLLPASLIAGHAVAARHNYGLIE